MDAELGGMALAAAFGVFWALVLASLLALRLRSDRRPLEWRREP
jgi:hypothetical protein